MNKKQTIIMWVGIVVFILLGLVTNTVIRPRRSESGLIICTAHYGDLFVRLSSTVLVTVAMIYTLRDKKPPDEQ